MPDRLSPVFRHPAARWLTVALAFCGVAILSLVFSKFADRVAAVWPANAILLAYCLHRRTNVTSTVVSGFLGNVCANLVTGDPLGRAAVLSAINAVEIALCFVMMKRAVAGRVDLTRPRQLAYFVIGAATAIPALSAALAASWLTLRGDAEFASAWTAWWLTDALGLVIFTPAALVLLDGPPRHSHGPTAIRRGTAYFGGLLAVLAVVFLQNRLPILYLVPPVLVLITFQMGLYGGALGLLLTAVFSNMALIMGFGPTTLISAQPEVRVVNLQFFLAFLALTTLPLASVLGVRRRLETEIAAQRDRAEASAKALARTNAVAALAEQMVGLGYWVEDSASGERTWSEEMYRIYGVATGATPPSLDQELCFYHPDDRDLVRQSLDPQATLITQPRGGYRLNSHDGARRVITTTRTLFHDDGSSVRLGVLLDVTRIYQAEEDLAESRTRYERLVKLIPDVIISHDAQLKITYASAAVDTLGYAPHELIGHKITNFIHPDDLENTVARARDNTSYRPLDLSIRREQRIRTKRGEWVWLEGRPALIPGSEGAPAEVLIALRDVSARRELEDALSAARTQAERALKVRTEFLANMSHELRTPLTAIVGFSGLLRGVGELGPRDVRFVDRIETASQALLCLVDDVLDLSRLESGGVQLVCQSFETEVLVAEVMDLVTTQAQAKGLALHRNVDNFLMSGDRARIRQILVNLLGNAVKFTSEGEVRLASIRRDGQVCFTVSDTGPGIPTEAQARIFERFTQIDGASTRAFGGIGLGLAISKSLAAAMGGRLLVTSVPGEGARFELWLPIVMVGPELA